MLLARENMENENVIASDNMEEETLLAMENMEEGSGLDESIMNNVRGDIDPDSYYDDDYTQFLPLHNDFLDDYGESDYGESDYGESDGDEEVCDHPNCWTVCSEGDGAENTMVCGCCPVKRPVKLEDIQLSVTCSPSGAVMGYNLSSVTEFGLEDMRVLLSYKVEGEEDIIDSHEVEDFEAVEYSWPGLCSGTQYSFCLEVQHSNMSSLDMPLCQVGIDQACNCLILFYKRMPLINAVFDKRYMQEC